MKKYYISNGECLIGLLVMEGGVSSAGRGAGLRRWCQVTRRGLCFHRKGELLLGRSLVLFFSGFKRLFSHFFFLVFCRDSQNHCQDLLGAPKIILMILKIIGIPLVEFFCKAVFISSNLSW